MADSKFKNVGTPRIAHELAIHLLEGGHDVFGVTNGVKAPTKGSRPYPVSVIGPHFSLQTLPRFVSMVRGKCDLIHFHGGEQMSYFARISRLFCPIPVVFTFTFIPSIFRRTMPPLTRLMLSHLSRMTKRTGRLSRLDHSIALTEFARKKLIMDDGFSPSEVSIIRYGISDDYLEATSDGSKITGPVAYTTGPSDARGFHDFLQSVPITLLKHPHARFAALARDDLEFGRLRNLCPPSVEVLAPRYFLNAIAPASVVVMPFRTHAAIDPPLSLLESMAAGKAIVTTPIGSIPEVLNSGRGQVVSTENPSEIAMATSQLLENNDVREEMAGAALHYARRFYNWKEAVSQITSVYQKVCN